MNNVCQFCRYTHKVTVPTIHMNGTAAKDLREGLQRAVDAFYEAQHRLVVAAPNGRDYYVAPGAMETVMEQHERRCLDVNRVLHELEEMLEHVVAVMYFNEQRRAG